MHFCDKEPYFCKVANNVYLSDKYVQMKYWKQILLTVSLFSAVVGGSVLTSSCEKNSCDGVTCLNGGSCGHGLCTCPTGYEDAQCGTKMINRFLGVYAGYTTCDHGAPVIDTVTIVPANRGITSVDVYYKGVYPKVLQGFVENNESAYTIRIVNNDSTKGTDLQYLRTFTVTLQSDKTLKVNTFEYERTAVLDTFQHSCEFVGVK